MSSRNENTTHISMGYRNAYYVYWWRKIITLSYLIEIQTGRYNEWKIMEFMKSKTKRNRSWTIDSPYPGGQCNHKKSLASRVGNKYGFWRLFPLLYKWKNWRCNAFTCCCDKQQRSPFIYPFFPQGGICVTGVTIQISYDFLKKWFQIMITVTLFLTIWQNGRYSYFLKKWIRNVKHKMQHIWIFMQSNKFVKLCIFLQQNVVWNGKSSKRQVRKVFSVLNMFLIMFMKTTAAISRPVK